ncbi:RluA family pseudouridine synthase [Myxococcota bacterium]|nr:RluA family pseudouridine synthase [Myxococcota bacterium]
MQALTFQAPSAGRLDALLKQASELSNSRARNAVSTGKVFVSGERVLDPATYIAAGTPIELRPNAPDPARNEPEGLRLVFRDEHLLVVDKPAGLLSAPLPDSDEVSALHAAYKLSRGGDRPRNVHRLDKETSGLLIFARTIEAARLLRQMMDTHEIRRIYRCVVQGVPKPPSGMISSMVLRDTGEGKRGSRPSTFKIRPLNTPDPGPAPGYGKLAITRYETVAAHNDRAALEVWLSTGRTHQIRIHLAELGTPVLGERVYAKVPGAPRQALHAAKLIFNHPVTREVLTFQSTWPKDLANVTPQGPGW